MSFPSSGTLEISQPLVNLSPTPSSASPDEGGLEAVHAAGEQWNASAQSIEELRDVPRDQSSLPGKVDAYPVDAVHVVVVEQQVSGKLLYGRAVDRVGARGGLAVGAGAMHTHAQEAVGEVERLGRMVQGLLALARLENTATTPEPVDLDAVVTDRVAMWEPLATEQYVAINITGPPAGHVWAIPGALEQVIGNLLANALRVSPPSTTITLHRTPGTELHIIDLGPRLSEADRARAFDRFWRASDSHHDGTGLGLPIVRHLIDASSGTITLHPAPGTGLDAHVRLRPVTPRPRDPGKTGGGSPLLHPGPRTPAVSRSPRSG
jgi:signal transduction histidine kinase